MLKVKGVVFVVAFLAASAAHAQATRTWVSGVGDDANPCSRTAPCKTFAGAISKTAAKGEINALDPGGFGAVTITKAITIDGGGGIAGVLVSGTNGIVINTAATDTVVLRNIEIDGLKTGLSGIDFLGAGHLKVENVKIYGFTLHGIYFRPTANSDLLVDHVSTHTNGAAGIALAPQGAAKAIGTVTNSTVEGNYRGIKVSDGASVAVRNSSLSHNVSDGVGVIYTSRAARAIVDNSILSGNSFAGANAIGTQASVILSHNLITLNLNGVTSSGGGQIISFGNNRLTDNTAADGTITLTAPEE